ncbi:terpene synthase family protein [Streptomyces monticola]|uniref:Terpene synthase n=1 Tax=Streptomyces monticola TaxID=2666263 RepID=A0ABW2JQL7_9ACTN
MDADANRWAFGLFSDDPRVPVPVRADNYTMWAALCFPDAPKELLALWCRFNALYTVIENKQEALFSTADAGSAEETWSRTVHYLYRLSHAPDLSEIPADEWGGGLPRHYVMAARSIALTLPEGLGRYFLRRVAQMATAQFQEPDAIRSPRMWLAEYLEYRHVNFGIPLFIATIRGLMARDISAAEWESPYRAELDRLTAHHCCLTNDLYSFQKEWNDRDGKAAHVQAVGILSAMHGLSVQEAIDRLAEEIEAAERSYVALRDTVAMTPEMREYCMRLEHITAGNLRYHQVSPRFHGRGFEGVFNGGEITVMGRPSVPR